MYGSSIEHRKNPGLLQKWKVPGNLDHNPFGPFFSKKALRRNEMTMAETWGTNKQVAIVHEYKHTSGQKD